MKIVGIDRRGRVVIPKSIRLESGIQAPGKLIVTNEGPGKVGLQSIETSLREAQQIGRRKLSGWKEEKHKEDRLALKLAERKSTLIHPPMKSPAEAFAKAGSKITEPILKETKKTDEVKIARLLRSLGVMN